MNLQDMRNCVYELLEQLAGVEAKMNDSTQSHSDQQLLDQAWEDLNDQIAVLQEAIEMVEDALDAEADALEESEGGDVDSWEGSQTSESEEEEEPPRSYTIQRVYKLGEQLYVTQEELDMIERLRDTDERNPADYYEAEYGVYYNAADEV